MKRTLAYILLLANLCSGIAFAWDSHPEAMLAGDLHALELMADDLDEHVLDVDYCDHCCHGASHLIGLFFDHSHPSFLALARDELAASPASPDLLYIAPLLRPPIV